MADFESDFREINGRTPTAHEIRQHLAFERLCKTRPYDPLTMQLISFANRRSSPSWPPTAVELRAAMAGGFVVAALFAIVAQFELHPAAMAFVFEAVIIVAIVLLFLWYRSR